MCACLRVCILSTTGNGKSFGTFLTAKKGFSSVCSYVHCQRYSLWKSFSTQQAAVKFLPCTYSHVLCQITGSGNLFLRSWQQYGFSPVTLGAQRVQASWKGKQFLMASRHLVWLPVQGTGGLTCHTWWVWSWGAINGTPKIELDQLEA